MMPTALFVSASVAAAPFECWNGGQRPEGIAVPEQYDSFGATRGMMRVAKLGDSKWDNTDGHDLREVKTEGELNVLVVLVNFQDVKFTVGTDSRQVIDDMLNKPGFNKYGATGSAFDFYHATSFGQFSPKFHVYGPVQLDKNEVDYVKTTETYTDPTTGKDVAVYAPGRMVEEAVRKLDEVVNFADFDSNKDGAVDFVYFFFPGKGATTGGNKNTTIWPHAFTLTSAIGYPVELDGVSINRYATSSELGSNNRLSGVGTFCHEFGHVLGLPDLYDTKNNNGTQSDCFTPGTFDTMDGGNYNNDEHTPAHFSGYEKYALEWMLPVDVAGTADVTMLPLGVRNFAYKVATKSNEKEYFILEARHRQGWDAYLEGEGLAVWHIDFNSDVWANNSVNNNANHQRIDLVEADDAHATSNRNGDLFPGSTSICEYSPNISPTFLDWSGKTTGYELASIVRHPDGAVSFSILAEDGKLMPGMDLASPAPRVGGVKGESATIVWDAVEGAQSYRLNVYPLASFDGNNIASFVDGYYFRDLGNVVSAEITGLKPGVAYGITLYALNEKNASRSGDGLEFTTISDNFAAAASGIYAEAAEEGTLLRWDEVEGAKQYLLTVGDYKAGETSSVATCDFTGNKPGDGWSGNGAYETRSNNCGAAAPSYRLSNNGSYLETCEYDKDIKSLSYWSRKRYSDGEGYLDFYSVDADGALHFLARSGDFGADCHVDFPAGVRKLRIVYTLKASGLDAYLDDMKLALAECGGIVPLSGYDNLKVGTTSVVVAGLEAGRSYSASVVAENTDGDHSGSRICSFVAGNGGSGVEEIGAGQGCGFEVSGGMLIPTDPTAEYYLYDLSGRCVGNRVKGAMPLPGTGVYVVKTSGIAIKVIN